MDDATWLAERFESHRSHLRAVAYRMLGSASEADDAVQEAWLRLSRADTSDVENLGGWLTTVVSRVCLDMLRSRKSRREEPLSDSAPDASADQAACDRSRTRGRARRFDRSGAARRARHADTTGAARLRVARHVRRAVRRDRADRRPVTRRRPAARQPGPPQGAAGRRAQPTPISADDDEVVSAFIAAARDGDFDELLTLLDPDVVLRADAAAVEAAAANQAAGAPLLSRWCGERRRWRRRSPDAPAVRNAR